MAEFEKVIGTITVNKNILQVDNQFAGNMFSSDLTYTVNFSDDFWDGFEILEWYAASSVVGETVVCKYDSANKKLKIPYGAYIKNGPLYISMRGIKDSVKYSTNILVLVVGENINIEENDIVNDPSWLDKVQAIIDDVFVSKYDPQYEALVQKVEKQISANKELLDKTQEQQNQIDNAIDIMGDYEIVQENPTQIRFKKGDGTYGDTVNLGDNLASKSMVNAGYDTYSGNSYSGSASDYGIEIGKVSGNYEQLETNGYQLFDASKLPTKSAGGATVTNNGDGSFTVSGSGNLTEKFVSTFVLSGDISKRLIKAGKISMKGTSTVPYVYMRFDNDQGVIAELKYNSNPVSTVNLTEEQINSSGFKIVIGIYGAKNNTITPGTIKPMVYQDGDGTWEPFTGGEPSPSLNYPQEIKNVDIRKLYSSSNLFDIDRMTSNTVCKATKLDDRTIKVESIKGDSQYYSSSYVMKNDEVISLRGKEIRIKYTFKESSSGIVKGRVGFQLNVHTPSGIKYFQSISSPLNIIIPKDANGINVGLYINNANSPLAVGEYVIFEDVQIIVGNTDREWQPYGFNVVETNLKLADGDVYENNKIIRDRKQVVFDGSDDESWGMGGDSTESILIATISIKDFGSSIDNSKLYCNRFISSTEKKVGNAYVYDFGKRIAFCVNRNEISDIDNFKTLLQTHPITAEYKLATPTTEEVELPVIPSYFPYTNAWHDSEVEASELTWNILARQYGSGQTTIKKDEAVLTELDLNTERTATPTTVKVQLKDISGNIFYVETSADNVYLKGTDGSEISQKNLNDKIGQLINLVAFYSANPTTVLADLKKYITTIS